MRIEGTHILPATIDDVFAGILDPDLLQHIIPGCERLIQLGPATSESDVTLEVRARTQKGPITLTLQTIGVRRPDHVQVEMWGHGPSGSLSGQISVDLAQQGAHTVGAYVLVLAEDSPATGSGAARRDLTLADFISTLCGRLSDALKVERVGREAALEADLVEQQVGTPPLPPLSAERRYHTSYGHIVAVPREWERRREVSRRYSEGIDQWAQRALWMSAGVMVGIGIISIGIGLARRLSDHGD